MILRLSTITFLLFCGCSSLAAAYQDDKESQKTKDGFDVSSMDHFSGYFDFYWDKTEGKVWLRLDGKLNSPFIYVTSLATGLGSNPVGLDRGQLGQTRMVKFVGVGPQVFLEQINLKYRAQTKNKSEQRAVAESFANSVIWSATIKKGNQKQLFADITDLIVRDAHQASRKLSSTGQGVFSFDKKKSFVYLPRTKAFPDNCEFEAAVTLTSSKPGQLARRTAATGNAITLRQHHSFVKLPDNNFRPRRFDPRCGSFSLSYQDYSTPIDEAIEKRLITRHRLKKKNPDAKKSEAVEPIVYYVDSGVPSPIKEALIEGASWWNAAFEDAGFIDAFQVKELPEDADPMDVRYNVIQWVHRATRGWSYGQSVVDPRTGEIIKGHVLLGSLRVRQDLTLMNGFRGARNAYTTENDVDRGFCNSCQATGMSPLPLARLLSREEGLRTALARIRQLSAHEVGHTLGFAHNFAASTYGNRASVMDYPAPRTRITGGRIDLSDAYGVGIGIWDRFTVRYAYTQFGSEKEEQLGLKNLVRQAIKKKMIYVSDSDSRPSGAAHPLANLWDNGQDPVKSLRHEIAVRKIALDRFSEDLIDDGEAMSELEKSFVPIYLHHRYQVDATSKMIGGVEYYYAVKGDGQETNKSIPVTQQQSAFKVLMETLDPKFLRVPDKVKQLIAPKPYSSASDRERFTSKTSPVFDTESAVESAADLTLGNILQPQRLARVSALNNESWNLSTIGKDIVSRLFEGGKGENEELDRIRRITQSVFVDRLLKLATNGNGSNDVNAWANFQLKRLRARLSREKKSQLQMWHNANLTNRIDRHFRRTAPDAQPNGSPEIPPGSPIGNQ